MLKLVKTMIIILLLIGMFYVIAFQVFDLKTIIMQKIYPIKYADFVEEYAKQYEIDPLLVYAIIKAESDFEPKAKSKSGAMGLMQLMENTAVEVAKQIQVEELQTQQIYNPQTNIELGTCYFSTLLKKYNQIGLALAAYNAGMGRVDQWLEQNIISQDASNLENIPYKETNMYVRKILNDYQIYQQLYNKQSVS